MARRRTRRFRGRRTVRRGRGVRRAFTGGLVRGRMHPPTNSASPWNTYVVTFLWNSIKEGIQCVETKDVSKQVQLELGITNDIDMRVYRVDIWTQPPEANTDRNCVVFSPSDWTFGDGCTGWAQINWYESWGTAVQPAHCHYVWPRSISNVVLSKQDTPTIFRLDCKDNKVKLIIKVHLTWRPSNPDPYRVKSYGKITSLRTHLHQRVPPSDDYELIDNMSTEAISPLACVVERCLSAE